MRLRRNEYCPIHKSISCCGREQTPYARRLQPGIRRIDDPHHPRGYRELRSPAEMRKLLNRKIVEQDRKCAICHEEFTDYNDVVPDHRNPKGMEERGGDLLPYIRTKLSMISCEGKGKRVCRRAGTRKRR